ncbi:MAG: hypothetical protein ABS76_30605 [Pelagibacterium sp. SCN 64-44]|nr:MAG: hypothetical protein ABS76_30605 [Pelagibacterium sp. SCN 64-44]
MELEPDMFGHRPAAIEHRSYFALYPDPALAQRIERDARDLGRFYNVRRVVRAGRLHVSLHGLQRGPELASDHLEEALLVGEAIRRPPFDLVFDQVQTWDGGQSGRPSPVATVLCCSEPPRDALALYEDVRRRMQQAGLKAGPRTFSPHLTLWYAPGRIPSRRLARPVRLRVQRFCLVHTATGVDQPDYLACWPLKF